MCKEHSFLGGRLGYFYFFPAWGGKGESEGGGSVFLLKGFQEG